jgi:hypothetical protein
MSNKQELTRSTGGSVTVHQTGLTTDVTVGNELSPAAAAAQAKAEIEARIIHAMQCPRNIDQFRLDLLHDCERPRFAEIALFEKPVGGKNIVDFSIRFIEAAIRCWTNMHIVSRITSLNDDHVTLSVGVLDVQTNTSFTIEAVVEKLVERREVKQGRVAKGMRQNTYGDTVYLIEANHDEVRNLIGSERSKIIRDNVKRLLPRDVLDECRERIEATLADATAKDPDSAKRKVLDKFAKLGVSAVMLQAYLGRPLETMNAKDLTDLAPLYNGLKEGEFTWADVTKTKDAPAEGDTPRNNLRKTVMADAAKAQPTAAATEEQKP